MSEQSQPQFSLRGAVDLSGFGKPAPAPHAAAAGADSPWVIDVNDTNFRQVVEGSAKYVVLLMVWLPADPTCQQVAADLTTIANDAAGAFQLARVDADASPNIARALQAQGIPTVYAIIAGQPVPMFQGAAPIDQVRDVVKQVLEAAQANGVQGTAPGAATAADEAGEGELPEPELPPLHQEAHDAIDAGDFDGAIAAYNKALREDPRDTFASAGLAQVALLKRLSGADAAAIRDAAAKAPADVAAQLAVADLDFAGGKVEDALGRLLDLLLTLAGEEKDKVRGRIIDFLAVLGPDDPRVAPARRRLAAALY